MSDGRRKICAGNSRLEEYAVVGGVRYVAVARFLRLPLFFKENGMLIAVASRDAKEINEHFGHANLFYIYEVEGGNVTLKEEKRVEKYCSDDPDHGLRKPVLTATAETLKECRAVVCAQIGQAPQMELERLGMDVYAASGPIRETLVELAKVI
jgi:predicted Fe-Mo cluster-binding NifX family protein